MPEPADNARIVLTTTATPEEARTLSRTLVEEGLAACVSIVPSIESVYRWEGKIESANETMLLIKTAKEHLAALEQRLRAVHSYDVPEFLVLPLEAGSAPYLKWLDENLRSVSPFAAEKE
jgi:periplasmic divalent cation tolerance protein